MIFLKRFKENWESFCDVILVFGMAVGFIVTVLAIGTAAWLLLKLLIDNMLHNPNTKSYDFGFLTKPFKTISSGFKSVVYFFQVFFKSFKENHCPPINWDED